MTVWDLDKITDRNAQDRKRFYEKKGLDKGTDHKFSIGDVIEFWSGYNDDIRMRATIEGIGHCDKYGVELYVYKDAYWAGIFDSPSRCIAIIHKADKGGL